MTIQFECSHVFYHMLGRLGKTKLACTFLPRLVFRGNHADSALFLVDDTRGSVGAKRNKTFRLTRRRERSAGSRAHCDSTAGRKADRPCTDVGWCLSRRPRLRTCFARRPCSRRRGSVRYRLHRQRYGAAATVRKPHRRLGCRSRRKRHRRETRSYDKTQHGPIEKLVLDSRYNNPADVLQSNITFDEGEDQNHSKRIDKAPSIESTDDVVVVVVVVVAELVVTDR